MNTVGHFLTYVRILNLPAGLLEPVGAFSLHGYGAMGGVHRAFLLRDRKCMGTD